MSEWIRAFDERLDVRPPLSDEQLAGIPARRGVVALLGADDVPIVLLIGADIRGRLRGRLAEPPDETRRRTVDLRSVTRAVLWKRADSHFEADWQYLEIARRIWPKTYGELLAWRPAWFVHVNPDEPFPHFARARQVGRGDGLYVGPFPSGRAADALIGAIQDAFDLCRDPRCLRQSPNAPRCSYAQMNRCLSPCDGTISMDEYREAMAKAAEFAAGRGEELRTRMKSKMKQAAAELAFEQAAAIRSRLERLAELDKPACAQARPLEAFRYILVQASGSSRRGRVFLSRQGELRTAGHLDYPLKEAQLRRVLRAMTAMDARPVKHDEAFAWRVALVSSYLFCSGPRRGVMLRWTGDTTSEQLAAAVEAGVKDLKLRPPRKKKPKAAKPSAKDSG